MVYQDQAQIIPEGTNNLHKEVVPISLVPTPAILRFHQEFPMVNWYRKRKRRPGLLWFSIISSHHSKVNICSTTESFSGTSLKDNGEGKSSQWTRFQAVQLVLHFGKKNGQTCYYIPIHRLWAADCFWTWPVTLPGVSSLLA